MGVLGLMFSYAKSVVLHKLEQFVMFYFRASSLASLQKHSFWCISIIYSCFCVRGPHGEKVIQLIYPSHCQLFTVIWSGKFVSSNSCSKLSLFFYRVGSSLVAGFPSSLPWMSIPCKEYWHLCRNSVMECRRT